jgi:hypothetical protein
MFAAVAGRAGRMCQAKVHGLILLQKNRGGGGSRTTLTFRLRGERHSRMSFRGAKEVIRSFEVGLILRNRGGLSGGPIRAREFDTPESRRRREEFDAHALPLVRIVAEVDHPALLLVLRERIGEDEKGSDLQLLVGIEQGAMRIDNDRFAGVLKSPALMVLAREQHTYAHEHPGTAAFAFVDGE